MPLTRLHHITIHSDDMEGTRDFYEKVLGLKDGPRPQLRFPGYWLYCGDTPVIHLVPSNGRMTAGPTNQGTGHFDHFAFTAQDFDGMRRQLASLGIKFEERENASAKLQQLFFPDPNGVMVELNFVRPD